MAERPVPKSSSCDGAADEADWHTKGIFQGSRAELDGFMSGIVVWVRGRTVGRKGVMGSWCDLAQILVV
jgi:hypothetical protein